jgi:hypothetical protein
LVINKTVTMKDLGITKGDKWEVRKADPIKGAHIVCLGDFKGDITFWHHFTSESEAIANAKLTADAGNTAQKCGLLPSELLKQRDELLERLKDLIKTHEVHSDKRTAQSNRDLVWSKVNAESIIKIIEQ